MDFSNFLHIVPEETLGLEPICSVVLMAEHLETCKFKDFWAAYDNEPFVKEIPGFENSIRSFIASVLSLTFQSAPLSLIKQYLNFKTDAEVNTFAGSESLLEGVEGDVVKFVLNNSNQPEQKSKGKKQGIQIQNLQNLLSKN